MDYAVLNLGHDRFRVQVVEEYLAPTILIFHFVAKDVRKPNQGLTTARHVVRGHSCSRAGHVEGFRVRPYEPDLDLKWFHPVTLTAEPDLTEAMSIPEATSCAVRPRTSETWLRDGQFFLPEHWSPLDRLPEMWPIPPPGTHAQGKGAVTNPIPAATDNITQLARTALMWEMPR